MIESTPRYAGHYFVFGVGKFQPKTLRPVEDSHDLRHDICVPENRVVGNFLL